MRLRSAFPLVTVVCLAVAGCGEASVQSAATASSGKSMMHTSAVDMRAKLNAMSVPDRLAYLKQHPDTVRAAAGGSAPMPLASQFSKPAGSPK